MPVIHDRDFMKLANVNLQVRDGTLDEIREIDVGSWFDPRFADERVPTLAEVLEETRGRAHVVIELKYYGHDRQLEQREDEERMLGIIKEVLEPVEQRAIWLRCFEKVPVEEITRLLGIESASGARAVLQKARRKLRTALNGS